VTSDRDPFYFILQMIYLLLGEDGAAKESKIAQIKAQNLPSDDALKLDFESIDGQKCDPAQLKKALLALPAISKNRLIHIQSTEKFNDHNKKIILDFIDSDHSHVAVIFNSDAPSAKNNFLKKIAEKAEVLQFGRAQTSSNVFDMTRAMERRDPTGALKMLDSLLDEGNHPLQIMGALVWFWGKCKNRLSAESFKKGLLVLQEADLNIKRSRLNPNYCVEIVVTKLSSLIAC